MSSSAPDLRGPALRDPTLRDPASRNASFGVAAGKFFRSQAFRRWLLASAAVLPSVVPFATRAQPNPPPSADSGTADAIRVLLDQATYWRSQYQPQRADEALARVLALDPRNVDALAQQAQAAADRGNQQQARAALAKLAAVRPDDPRIASVQQALQIGPLDASAIAEARRLAQTGKSDDAVAAYRRAIKGDTPPPSLAIEYYQAEASTETGWNAARDGLAALVRANPQDLRAQLAFAQVLTYREGTREDGIDRLAALSQQPSLKAAARKSWHDALLWSGDDERAQHQLEAYLKDNPSDAQIDARRADLKASVPDEGAKDRLAGYQALETKQTAEAERNFQAALKFNPQDVESLVMMAAIRRVQGKEAEVQRLEAAAKAVDPDRANDLINSVGLNVAALPQNYAGNNGGGGDYGAASRRAYANVERLTNRGEYAAAEAALRKLMGSRPPPGSYIQLGYIQLRAGQLAEAEGSFRRVLASDPRSKPALNGLAGTLSRQGKTDEAEAIYARLGNRSGLAGLEQTRAASLREQAKAATDPAEKVRLYRQAIAADPADPWVHLELARVLLEQSKPAEAREVMQDVTSGPRPSVDQLRAGIYFADAAHDYATASALVKRLPPASFTPEMRDVEMRADAATDLQDARAAGGLRAMERRMMALAQKPDPTGARGVAFARELTRYGDKAGAREVLRTALAASRPPLPQQRIAYAQMLIGAGYPQDAQTITAGLNPTRLSPVERTNLADVQDTSAVVESDTLNGHGRTADAYDELAPRLATNPENPALNMALARLYQSKNQTRTAQQIDEELLKRNPGNISVAVAAINAAVAANDYRRADALVAQLKEQQPEDPQTWIAAAQVARSRGNNGQALSDLRTARNLRKQQIGADDTSDASDAVLPAWIPGQRYALNLPAGVATDASPEPEAQDVQAAAPDEPVTREYERYAQAEPVFAASPGSQPPNPAAPTLTPGPATPVPDASGLIPLQPPVVLAQDGATGSAVYNNPFRSSPAPVLDEPGGPPGILGLTAPAPERRPLDPLEAEIDSSIQQISRDVAPQISGTFVVRGRTGVSGLAELLDFETPLEASFSPNGYGRLKVTVTPVFLYADKATAANQAQFGTNPLAVAAGNTIRAGNLQTAGGSALDVSYSYSQVTADIGSTPLGFNQTNVVGGIEYAPRLTQNMTLRVLGERRAVNDSLLSYAGARDPNTGQSFGGVTRNRGHIQLEGSVGTVNYYAGAGGGVMLGQQVKSNTEIDAGAGFSLPVWSNMTQSVRMGLDLVYFGYKRNLGGFTLGDGGYFSPQHFFAALIPVDYRHQVTPDWYYDVGGSVGVQTFRASSQAVFPDNAAYQAELQNSASGNPGITTRNAGFGQTGLTGGIHAATDYAINSNLHVGGSVGFDRSGNFTEGTGLVYARYVFADPKQ